MVKKKGSFSEGIGILETPRIGITMGDPSGIGPEVVLKSLSKIGETKGFNPFIIGDFDFLLKTRDELGITLPLFRASEKDPDNGIIVYDLANVSKKLPIGKESAEAGKAAGEYIIKVVDLWKLGAIDGIVTAPINKNSLAMGGINYPGHTEFLAYLTGTKRFAMSFFAGDLSVVLLSTHVSLSEAIGLVKKDALIELIRFTDENLSKLHGKKVKIAVAGLNPHASENGMFGDEEAREIAPAVRFCREDFGIDVSGPFSPDTIFVSAYKGAYDAVISCYHDQATIAVKCLSFGASVNVTLGLPLVRTSVDHGTAFEIAGKNLAESSSMEAAIFLASRLVNGRLKQTQRANF